MITCDRCKTENLDGSQYCDECGAPLRPNGRPSAVQQPPVNGAEGRNGNRAQSPGTHPEFAANRVSAGLNFSALRTPAKPHARLVIEKGR
ncbi:MAG TPA: zinc ribbon domain-containing protein, partial [Pyrinomonadaceae bacterium]|nr:zinc ribbon domain-containing protein [Pyrinomonadaceae bacterium]